jgi:hypothetical protein
VASKKKILAQWNPFTFILSSYILSDSRLYFFLRNTVQLKTLIHTRVPIWTHTRTSYPYEHLQETVLKNWSVRIWDWRNHHKRLERRLPLENIPALWDIKVSNLRFKLCWAGGTSTLLTIQPHASSRFKFVTWYTHTCIYSLHSFFSHIFHFMEYVDLFSVYY